MSNPVDPNTPTSTKPKRKKASGWDKWKAKKKAQAALNAGLPTPVVATPVVPTTPDSGGVATPPAVALKNHYAIILDRSGSMGRIRESTIASFNEQVQSVRTASRGQATDVSLFTFSTHPDAPTFFTAPVDSLVELNTNTYRPSGDTALFDTIIAATDRLSALPDANDPSVSFLVCIITDGEENCSRTKPGQVAERIESLQATKRWTFTFVGANIDVRSMTKLGVAADNTRSFTSTAAGVQKMSQLHSEATKSYFSARSAGATQTLDLYKRAEEALKKQQEEAAKKSSGTV